MREWCLLTSFLDNQIVLDNDQAVDKPDAAAPDVEKHTFEVADPVDYCGPSPTLSSVLTKPGTDDGKNTQNSLTQYTRDSCGENEEERDENLREDETPNNDTIVCGEGVEDDIGSDAPASAGLIHDVFAEYERTFSMPRRKQRVARPALHDYRDNGIATGSIPPPISHPEPRAVADDDVTGMEQPVEAAGEDVGPNNSSRGEIENGSTFQPRWESNRQGTETDNARSRCVSRLASDCNSGKSITTLLNLILFFTCGS